MNRRAFLTASLIGPAVVLPPALNALAKTSTPNTFDHLRSGVTIHWSGWREPANQIVSIGFWTATHGRAPFSLVSVAPFGRVQWVREMNVIDLCCDFPPDVSMRDVVMDEEVREGTRKRALLALVETLERIAPSDRVRAFEHGHS